MIEKLLAAATSQMACANYIDTLTKHEYKQLLSELQSIQNLVQKQDISFKDTHLQHLNTRDIHAPYEHELSRSGEFHPTNRNED